MVEARKIQDSELRKRDEKVLKYLIREYIRSGFPVASSHLVDMARFRVGSATLRSVLHKLESIGYLSQPYTSAGRVPTDLGYRYFVDRLMTTEQPEEGLEHEFQSYIDDFSRDLKELIQNTSYFLADVSDALVMISQPHEIDTRIRSIALHELDSESVLLIVTMSLRQVKTIAFQLPARLSRHLLREAENILNEMFAGMLISEIINMPVITAQYDRSRNPILQKILKNIKHVLGSKPQHEFSLYGSHQLLHYPEFMESSHFEPLLESIENASLFKMLPSPHETGIPKIMIGREMKQSLLNNMSLVSIAYKGKSCSGEIHILGPMRMPYEKIAGLAQFTANKVGQLIRNKFDK